MLATGYCEIAINERIKKAWFAFHNHGGVLLGKRGLSMKQRGIIHCACVRPVMTCSCETWTLKLEHKRRLLSTERRMTRMMCGVTLLDRIPSDSILSRLGIQKTVIDCVEKSKLRLFGHVVRREDSSPIQEAFFLEVPGKKAQRKTKKDMDRGREGGNEKTRTDGSRRRRPQTLALEDSGAPRRTRLNGIRPQ